MRAPLRLVHDHRRELRALGGGHLLDSVIQYRDTDRRRLTGPPPDTLVDHLWRYGERPRSLGRASAELIATLDAVGLTGRGGAHFPAAKKWATVRAAGGGGYVVANAAEGEPASAKDTALLQHRPHLVLDGLAAAAEALAAVGTVIWLHDTADDTRLALRRALAERRAAGLVEPPVHLASGPEHYLTGESSAVINGLAGGPALPTFNRVPAARAGLDGRPTLVHNVETLARVGLLARTAGAYPQPGPLLTVASDGVLAVCEAAPQTTLDEVLRLSGAPGNAPRAVLLGGYGGSWVDWDEVAHRPVGQLDGRRSNRLDARTPGDPTGSVPSGSTDRAGPARRRFDVGSRAGEPLPSLGAGVLGLLPRESCGLAQTAALLDFLASSSARQCGPCVFGTRELADLMGQIARGAVGRRALRRVTELTDQIDGRGACGLPNGAAQLTRTAIDVFASDLRRHLDRDPCPPGAAAGVLPIPGGNDEKNRTSR